MFDIFSFLIECFQRNLLIVRLLRKNKQRVNQERKIKISVGIINQINNHFYQRQKGRVLSMLVASREAYKVNKKIKENKLHMKLVRKKQNKYWRRVHSRWIMTLFFFLIRMKITRRVW